METILTFITLVAWTALASVAYSAYEKLRTWNWRFKEAMKCGLDSILLSNQAALSVLWLIAVVIA